MIHSIDIKPPRGPKQVARKRKRESTSSDPLSPTSPNETGKRNKRATRACERCRNKKIKCDIERDIACNACVDANVICEAGNGKHTEDKKYPPGYTESMENTNQAMVLAIDKLYRMIKDKGDWTFAEPRMKDGGNGRVVIHDICQALGCIRNAPGLPECFVEDAPALLTRLLVEEKSKVKQEVQTEPTTSTEEPSPKTQLNPTKCSPEFKVESPVELPLPNYSSQLPQSPETDPLNTTKTSIQQSQPLKSFLEQAPISRSVFMDQRPDVLKMSQDIFSASFFDIPHGHIINKSSNPSAINSFTNRNPTAQDGRRAPILTIQPYPYHFQEQSALSVSSTESTFSTTYHTNSPVQSNTSELSPHEMTSPLSSVNSYEGDYSISASQYWPNLQKDALSTPSSGLDLGSYDSMFDLGFDHLDEYPFSAEDVSHSLELSNY